MDWDSSADCYRLDLLGRLLLGISEGETSESVATVGLILMKWIESEAEIDSVLGEAYTCVGIDSGTSAD